MVEQLVELIFGAGMDQQQLLRVVAMTKAIERSDHLPLILQLGGQPDRLESAQGAIEAAFMELAGRTELDDQMRAALAELYAAVTPENNIRNNILYWLGTEASPASVLLWCNLITDIPPKNANGLIQAFTPMFQNPNISQEVFNKLTAKGISHPEIASASLDLMNFHARSGNLSSHPALQRAPQLTSLLGNVVQQMARVEEGNVPADLSPQELSNRVSESVALTISLCDAIGLMDYQDGVGKLRQAMQLKHRRIQTEAAASLARMGVEEGRSSLCKLAEEPIARLRVLAFAEELDFLDEVPEEQQTEVAIAESQLAVWLAEPTQMSVPPSKLELLNNRELYWPSYEHPVQCYLFRFTYGTDPAYSNVGIAGPVNHVFPNNIESLTLDDIYAAFAGWHAVHEEIYQLSLEQAHGMRGQELQVLLDKLREQEFDSSEPIFAGSFFGELVLVAEAVRNSEPVVVLVDQADLFCFTSTSDEDRIDPKMAYTIWRGRRFLEQFNS